MRGIACPACERLTEAESRFKPFLMFLMTRPAIHNTAVERDISLIVLGLTGKNAVRRGVAGNCAVS